MVKTIIEAFPKEKRTARDDGSSIINIAELFSNTIQGENFSGFPSTFLRLQGCILDCSYCDTKEVFKEGNPYSVWELVELFMKEGIAKDLKEGHHLVITGGSPLLQQNALAEFIDIFQEKCGFKPFIEMENECVIVPSPDMIDNVNLWNCSPKLSNSGVDKVRRIRPEALALLSQMDNAFFKFVISFKKDWEEIQRDFIDTELIRKGQIVLMPEGSTRTQLQDRYDLVVDLCCKHSVRMSDRLHVTIWDKTIGV